MNEIMAAWPLDRLIAVNPFWPHINEPFASVVARRDPQRDPFIVSHVSETCAAYFDRGQATWRRDVSDLYTAWIQRATHDLTPVIVLGLARFREEVRTLPRAAKDMLALARKELGTGDFLRGLRGWASYCAYAGELEHLTAIGAAWDVLMWRLTAARPRSEEFDAPHDATALERGETALQEHIVSHLAPSEPKTVPSMQVVFCIDVRSEIMRRAVELEFPSAQTLGFAGFFGLRLTHNGVPHLPGPLIPQLESVTDRVAQPTSALDRVKRSASSMFTFVETLGIFEAVSLAKMSVGWRSHATPRPKPRLVTPLSVQDKATTAAGILRGMSLTRNFAPRVLLIGHGASTTNNAHAHAYDCGACGGQQGDVSARLVAELLNDQEVREALVSHGIVVPEGTRFVAGLHDTTTDDITLFEDIALNFQGATRRARQARLAQWSETRAATARAADWSEPRPEWGLCNNAVFIAAPRSRTKHMNLESRAFLHEYDAREDKDWQVLTQILTAPVVVAHWINMQYFASSTAPDTYGAGNKVLHDVCAGGLGVLEGNGGDLRIGLPLQAVHDGSRLRHEPLRLSVFIDAPQSAIDEVVGKHVVLQQLVNNKWLYLVCIDENKR